MKKYNKIKSIAILMACVFATSCTDGFDELNTNPNTLTEDQLDATLAGPSFASALYAGIHNGSYSSPGVDDQGTWGIGTGIMSGTFVQYMYTGYETNNNEFGGHEGRAWTRFYTVAVPALKNAIKAAKGFENETAILKIWKAFMYNQMTDSYGPIPYTESGSGKEKIAYDSQETIYEDFFKLLDEADTVLANANATTANLFQISDKIYKGNIEKWRIFGNSLRLRLAMRISDINPAKAKTQAELAVANGVIEFNEQSAAFEVSNITPNNLNMIVNGWEFFMSASMESILKGYDDPRMKIWFSPIENGDFQGRPIGDDKDPFGTTKFSTFNDDVLGFDYRETKGIEILMAAECFFTRAEGALDGWNMNGTAENLYNQGIQLSLNQWEVTDQNVINDYISGTSTPVVPSINEAYPEIGLETPPVTVPVAWAASEVDQRTQIAVQKYLALFPESWETWSDLRRSDANIIYPLIHTNNNDVGVGKSLMKRAIFVTNEISANGEAVEDATTKLDGPDTGGTKLWWDVN